MEWEIDKLKKFVALNSKRRINTWESNQTQD